MRTLRFRIGGFLREAVELRREGDAPAVLAEALRYYAERLRGLDLPAFLRTGGPEEPSTVEVPVEDEIAEIFTADCERQEISQDLLATHAAFAYLADSERESDELGPEPLSIVS